jgi:tRNA(fMet)-specific endonuclease VapC
MTRPLALDTNAFSAIFDGDSVIIRLVNTTAQVAIPSVVLGELYYGYFYGSRREKNLSELATFLAETNPEILEVNAETAKLFGEISAELRRAGRPIQQNDIWIAALCKQHGYVLATRDADFQAIIGLETVSF